MRKRIAFGWIMALALVGADVCLVGEAPASSAPGDQLRAYGVRVNRPQWYPLYAFSVSCSALPCRIQLTERAMGAFSST